jgi:drug/metabolite transporter (DMT)-like permease
MAFAFAGFTLWVLTDTSIKLVGQTGLPWYEVLGFLGLFMVLFLLARGWWRGDLHVLRPHRLRPQFLRSVLDLGNNICVIVALHHLTLTLFYILIFLAPITVSLLSSIFLRERLPWHKALAILTGFAGVVVAVHPWSGSRQADWIGYTACFVCVACFSVNMVLARVLTRTESPESLTLFSGVAMTVVGFSLMGGFRLMHPHMMSITPRMGALLVAVGVLCASGSLCFFVALKNTAAANVSQIHYTQLVTGALMAWLVWRQAPTLLTLAGAALIIVSGLYIATMASRDHHSTWISPPVHPD